MENLLFLGVPILKHIRVCTSSWTCLIVLSVVQKAADIQRSFEQGQLHLLKLVCANILSVPLIDKRKIWQ